MPAHSQQDVDAHRPGIRENLVVTAGALDLKIGTEIMPLKKGDTINFSADQPHSDINRGADECLAYLVMTHNSRA